MDINFERLKVTVHQGTVAFNRIYLYTSTYTVHEMCIYTYTYIRVQYRYIHLTVHESQKHVSVVV